MLLHDGTLTVPLFMYGTRRVFASVARSPTVSDIGRPVVRFHHCRMIRGQGKINGTFSLS